MGDLQQSPRPGKADGAEVGADPVGQDGNVVDQHDLHKLIHLKGREELGLIDEHTVQDLPQRHRLLLARLPFRGGLRTGQAPPAHQGAQVVARVNEEVDATRHPEPGYHEVLPLGVDHRLDEQDALTSLLIVVGGLKQPGGLTGVHGTVAEVELGHAGPPEPDPITRAGCYPPNGLGAGNTTQPAHGAHIASP